MILTILQGFLLGLAYVAPIGAQNINVINAAAQKTFPIALRTTLFTVIFDITLALACFLGVGYIFQQFNWLKLTILLLGGILVTIIGIKLITQKVENLKQSSVPDSIGKIILTTFVVTWLNPQAIIDGSMLFGGTRTTLSDQNAIYFIIGVCLASAIWFLTLTFIVSRFKKVITSKVLRIINILCGSVIVFYGLKLIYNFVTEVFFR